MKEPSRDRRTGVARAAALAVAALLALAALAVRRGTGPVDGASPLRRRLHGTHGGTHSSHGAKSGGDGDAGIGGGGLQAALGEV